jgi:trans-aconitate methyltransferase
MKLNHCHSVECAQIVEALEAKVNAYMEMMDANAKELDKLMAERKPLTDVLKAAQGVLEWTEIAHRPPVRDKLEAGRMVMVRLHALADLHDALAAHGITKGGE